MILVHIITYLCFLNWGPKRQGLLLTAQSCMLYFLKCHLATINYFLIWLLVFLFNNFSCKGLLWLIIRYEFWSLLKAVRWWPSDAYAFIIWTLVNCCLICNHTIFLFSYKDKGTLHNLKQSYIRFSILMRSSELCQVNLICTLTILNSRSRISTRVSFSDRTAASHTSCRHIK